MRLELLQQHTANLNGLNVDPTNIIQLSIIRLLCPNDITFAPQIWKQHGFSKEGF
jgi:hypothetical protein